MKKFLKNPWFFTIGTTVIGGVLLTLVNDWIKKVDWLSTLKTVIGFIANAVNAFLNFELKVWWVLVAIGFAAIVLLVLVKISDTKSRSTDPPFASYKTDYVLGYTWEWDYKQGYDGMYAINNLHPVCSRCGMRLKRGGPYGLDMECLRCRTTQKWDDDYLIDAQMLIEDNIKKKYLQKQERFK
jgi:hypothetical protein